MEIPPVQRLLYLLKSNRSPVTTAVRFLLFGAALYCVMAVGAALISLRYKLPQPSYMLLDRHYRFIASVQNDDSLFGYWPLPDTLPDKAVKLAIAAEDRRFYHHVGVDLFSFARAVYSTYIVHTHISGASTIAMQVARIQGKHHRSLFHKFEESVSALLMTATLGREGILRRYLTIAPYGNCISGIGYAARRYFNKPLVDCTWAEMAVLTALPKAPGRMNLYRSSGVKRAFKRAELILVRARSYGMIDTLTYRQASIELRHFTLPKQEHRSETMLHAIHAVSQRLAQQPHIIKDRAPIVRLTLDIDIQEAVSRIAVHYMDSLRSKCAGNTGVLVLDRESGAVRCYLGSDDYFNTQTAGSIDYVQTNRSTGSLLKPFIYAFGMEWNGYTAATLLTDIGLFFGEGTNPYIPHNYDRRYLGPVLYQTALANSRNIPAIQVLQDVGLPLAYQKLSQLSIVPKEGNPTFYGLGLAVGNVYCSLETLCAAYLTLANGGVKRHVQWINPVDDMPPDTQIIPKDICIMIQHILSDPQVRLPSFPRGSFLEYPFPVAVKTGTSRGHRDAWTIGWSEQYLVGVWIGRHDYQPMNNLSGFCAAAPLAQKIFLYLHADHAQGLENAGFPPPRNYIPLKIDQLTGERAGDNSPYTSTVYFKPGTEPVAQSSAVRWITVDKRNGLLADPDCAPNQTEPRRFVVLPSIFKDWAEKQGLPLAPTQASPLCGSVAPPPDYAISILHPQHLSRLYIDPEMPPEQNMLILNCQVIPRVHDVVWIVDDKEFARASFPYTIPWPLSRGSHRFQVQVPFTPCKSRIVDVDVY